MISGSMRAYQLHGGGLENLKRTDLPIPQPQSGEVLVRVKAVSLNYRDKVVMEGGYLASPKYPFIPVSDGAGEVVAVGSNVSRFRPGDRVAGLFRQTWNDGDPTQFGTDVIGGPLDGMLAEYRVLPEHGLISLPANLTYEEGATLPIAALTAWYALVEEGKLKAGETVLLLGTGGVSIWGAQFAKLFGARPIITTSSDVKEERLRRLGFADIIRYDKVADWHEAARQLTGGRGVDHVLDVIGDESFLKAIKAVRDHGNVYVIGFIQGRQTQLNLIDVIARRIRIQGISVGHRRAFGDMNRAIEQNGLKPVIDQVFTFDQAPAAYDALKKGAFGKIVIKIA